MTVHELISKLEEVSMGDPDLDVEIRVLTGTREIESELLEDARAGETIITETCIDEYIEDISVGKTECGGHKKVCITADAG